MFKAHSAQYFFLKIPKEFKLEKKHSKKEKEYLIDWKYNKDSNDPINERSQKKIFKTTVVNS